MRNFLCAKMGKNMYGAVVAFFTFLRNVKNLVGQVCNGFVRQDGGRFSGASV